MSESTGFLFIDNEEVLYEDVPFDTFKCFFEKVQSFYKDKTISKMLVNNSKITENNWDAFKKHFAKYPKKDQEYDPSIPYKENTTFPIIVLHFKDKVKKYKKFSVKYI